MQDTNTAQVRCGIDIIEIDRVARAYQKRPAAFLERFFTAAERRHLQTKVHLPQHLAARFAAKEAVFKLLGCGLGNLSWQDVEIRSLSSGEPQVFLYNAAKKRASELALGTISLSMSHSRCYATAFAVAILLQKS